MTYSAIAEVAWFKRKMHIFVNASFRFWNVELEREVLNVGSTVTRMREKDGEKMVQMKENNRNFEFVIIIELINFIKNLLSMEFKLGKKFNRKNDLDIETKRENPYFAFSNS